MTLQWGNPDFQMAVPGFFFGRLGMGSLELLPYFCSLNTIPVVKILNFDYGHLSHPPYSWQNSVKGVKLLGGIGDSAKVYHIGR